MLWKESRALGSENIRDWRLVVDELCDGVKKLLAWARLM